MSETLAQLQKASPRAMLPLAHAALWRVRVIARAWIKHACIGAAAD